MLESSKELAFVIDNDVYFSRNDISVVEACKFSGVRIPRFCFHESLSIAGNCRMCLIELNIHDKLVIGCLTNIEQNMWISVSSLAVKKARESLLEILLINHPLDCPICDQGGECDLQEQIKNYSSFFSKVHTKRHHVEDKYFSSNIKTIMTRCISCTRCIRFSNEVLNVKNLGVLSRGSKMEVGTYTKVLTSSNLDKHLIDLCPVGAITSSNKRYSTRSADIIKGIRSIDITGSVHTSVLVEYMRNGGHTIHPIERTGIRSYLSNRARNIFDFVAQDEKIRYREKGELSGEIKNFGKNPYSNIFELFQSNTKRIKQFLNNKSTVQFTKNALQNFEYYKVNQGKKNSYFFIDEQLPLEQMYQIHNVESSYLFHKMLKFRKVSHCKEYQNFYYPINDSLEELEKRKSLILMFSGHKYTENDIINHIVMSRKREQESLTFVNLNLKSVLSVLEGKSLLSYYLLIGQVHVLLGDGFRERYSNIAFLRKYIKNLNQENNFYSISAYANCEGANFSFIKPFNLRHLDSANSQTFVNLSPEWRIGRYLAARQYAYRFRRIYIYNSFKKGVGKLFSIFKKYYSYYAYAFEHNGLFLNMEQKVGKVRSIKKINFNQERLNGFIFKNITSNLLKIKKNLNINNSLKQLLTSLNFKMRRKYFSKFDFDKTRSVSYVNKTPMRHLLSEEMHYNWKRN